MGELSTQLGSIFVTGFVVQNFYEATKPLLMSKVRSATARVAIRTILEGGGRERARERECARERESESDSVRFVFACADVCVCCVCERESVCVCVCMFVCVCMCVRESARGSM